MRSLFSSRGFTYVAVAVLIAVSVLVTVSWVRDSDRSSDDVVTNVPGQPVASSTSSLQPSDKAQPSRDVSPSAVLPAVCRQQSKRPFVPRTISFEGVAKDRPVLSLGEEGGAPQAPPFSQPDSVSWYNGKGAPRAASPAGNALYQAHTYSAREVLGNRALTNLKRGALIVVSGDGGAVACYEVKRAGRLYSSPERYVKDVYDFSGPHQLAFTVCSDYDAASDTWRTRTVWFAEPLQ